MIPDDFDRQTLAKMEVALGRVCANTPAGQQPRKRRQASLVGHCNSGPRKARERGECRLNSARQGSATVVDRFNAYGNEQ
jgi:hypothetical protein